MDPRRLRGTLGCVGCSNAEACAECERTGVGWIPLVAAAVSAGAGIWQAKKQQDAEKEAQEEAAKAAARVARQRAAQESKAKKWIVYGGVALVGVTALVLLLRRKRG
jgi:hypothetical protein